MSNHRHGRRKIKADVIEAGAILLVDGNGKKRAQLACMSEEQCEDGYVVAHFYDGDGRPRISLQVNEEGASIQLWNRSNAPCVSLGAINTRGSGITVSDGDGKPRVVIGISETGSAPNSEQSVDVEILDSDGKVTWSQQS